MKKFLKKIVIAVTLVYAMSLLALAGTSWWISEGNYFSLPKEKENIILGHSHSACAFNDTIIKGFYNLSQNTEGYPYSYFKAKKILDQNPHVKRIFIEFTNNQFTNFAKNRMWGDYISENMPRTIPISNFKFVSTSFLKNKNPYRITKTVYSTLHKNIRFLLYEDNYIDYLWREYRTPTRKFDGKTRMIAQYRHDSIYGPIQYRMNIDYLRELQQLCEDTGTAIYFTRSPFPKGTQFENEPQFQEYLENEFPEVPFMDFKNFPLPDEKFADMIHLNRDGRKEFSEFFNQIIENGILNSKDIEAAVQTEIVNFASKGE